MFRVLFLSILCLLLVKEKKKGDAKSQMGFIHNGF